MISELLFWIIVNLHPSDLNEQLSIMYVFSKMKLGLCSNKPAGRATCQVVSGSQAGNQANRVLCLQLTSILTSSNAASWESGEARYGSGFPDGWTDGRTNVGR
jgi:hypothetical protein